MKMRGLCLWLVLLSPLVSAGEAGDVFGEAMPVGEAESIALAVSRLQPDAEPAVARKFSGRITEVCQKKGCWMMLEDDGTVARVMVKDHAFAVPNDAQGGAVVFGTLSRITLDAPTARHLAQDAGKDQPVPADEYRIEAISVQLVGG